MLWDQWDQDTDALTSFHLDITFGDRKFSFQAADEFLKGQHMRM